MSRPATVWWNKQRGAWCTDIGGARHVLAKGKANKKLAKEKLKGLLEEQELLADVNGAITVAAMCDAFLEDALQNLERRTYESYRHGCQKFVDTYAARAAHTIGSQDVAKFARGLKASLNPTSQAIVLRTIERCFNWAAESRLIPPHKLGRIRKPQPLRRDRYLTDEEFQLLLRTTDLQNRRRFGAAFRRLLLALDWTLCRPGELVRLEWEHIHWEHDVAILADHKTKRTGKPKIIPLVPKMKRLLEWLHRRHKSSFCFVNSAGDQWTVNAVNQRMARIRNRCGLKGICPYTIRHRAATNAILRTGDLKMTSLLLGHTSSTTTERYTHLAQEHLVAFACRAVG
jgi:integrase/recombinase XerC